MLDRQKLESILSRRFPGAPKEQVAAAANAIMGLPDEWEEVLHDDHPSGTHFSSECGNLCYLAADGVADAEHGIEFRIFKRRES